MEEIIRGIDQAIVDGVKVYILHNGVEINLSKKELKGDSNKKRTMESRAIAEQEYSIIKQLKLL